MSSSQSLDQKARQAAQAQMGEFAWPTVVLGLATLVGYIAVPLLVAGGLVPLWIGVLIIMPLVYASYTVMHEAVHGSINGSHRNLRWVNELMGYIAGWILMIPLTAHRHEHLAHHRNTNEPDEDPDYLVSDMLRSPWQPIVAIGRSHFNQFRYFLKHRWQRGPRAQNMQFCVENFLALGLRLAFMAQGYWFEGATLFLIGGFGGVLLVMYLFAFLVHHPHKDVGAYVDTSTIVIPGAVGRVLTPLWGYQNYHSIHHLFPRVPFYRYREVFSEIEDVMVAKGAPIYRLSLTGLEPASKLSLAHSLEHTFECEVPVTGHQ